jgi:O-antigen ligase/polysaccharide polymerase Wzy-like membrane protein
VKANELKFARYDLPFRLRLPKRKSCSRRDTTDLFVRTAPPSTTEPSAQAEATTTSPSRPSDRLNVYWIHKDPTLVAAALFLLILSGPPRLRIRDPGASLRGEIDWVVILHVIVWTLAGLWVLVEIGKRFCAKRPLVRLRLPQMLGLALIACLGMSIWKSAAPALTAFKVYQMLVCLLFTQLFVERFGVRASLKAMLWGNALLCLAIATCAFLSPDMVWTASDFNPDPSRLLGELIAPTGVVSVMALILLLTIVRKLWSPLPLLLLVLSIGLLIFSLMRTAYIAAFVFFMLVLLRRPNIKPLLRFTYCSCVLLLLLYAGGQLPSVSRYRSSETISNLGDRIGLWRHLSSVTLTHSPWLGLGYYSASRIYGPEYNPGLGTAHSIFFEALLGGGVPSLAFLTALCLILSAYALRLLWVAKDRFSFALSTLFLASLLFGFMGDPLHSGPVAMAFWGSAASLPGLNEWSMKRRPRIHWDTVDATV